MTWLSLWQVGWSTLFHQPQRIISISHVASFTCLTSPEAGFLAGIVSMVYLGTQMPSGQGGKGGQAESEWLTLPNRTHIPLPELDPRFWACVGCR